MAMADSGWANLGEGGEDGGEKDRCGGQMTYHAGFGGEDGGKDHISSKAYGM